MDLCNGPYKHLFAFLQSIISDLDLDHRGSHLQRLVCGKAQEIMRDFDVALVGADWAGLLDKHPEATFLPNLCLGTFLCHAGSYNRRILEPTERFPLAAKHCRSDLFCGSIFMCLAPLR